MAREMKVFSFCDYCQAEDENREGTEHTIAIDKLQTRLVIACDVHEKPILELKAFIEGLDKADSPVGPGRPNVAQAAVGNRIPCRLCGSDYKTSDSLKKHVRTQHDVSWAAYSGGPAEDEQLELDPNFEIPKEFHCGVEGCDRVFDPRQYKNPMQAVRMHQNRAHGIAKDGGKVRVA